MGLTDYWVYLLPLCMLYPFARLINYYRDTVGKISSYISVFIEKENVSKGTAFPQWETRNSSLQLGKPTIAEEFGTHDRGYIRKVSELFMMALAYFALYLYRAGVVLAPTSKRRE